MFNKWMKKVLPYATIFIIFPMAQCVHVERSTLFSVDGWDQIQPGDSISRVLKILGDPLSTGASVSCYYYVYFDPEMVAVVLMEPAAYEDESKGHEVLSILRRSTSGEFEELKVDSFDMFYSIYGAPDEIKFSGLCEDWVYEKRKGFMRNGGKKVIIDSRTGIVRDKYDYDWTE